jgi:CheY-like chemotaxis protein
VPSSILSAAHFRQSVNNLKKTVIIISPDFVEKISEHPVKTVLLVDDNVDTRLLTKMFLNNFGYEVDSADSPGEALNRFNPAIHNLVLTDNSMPGMTGVEMAHVVKQRSPSTPVVMCTGNPPHDASSIDVMIKKPTHLFAIKDAVDKLLELH